MKYFLDDLNRIGQPVSGLTSNSTNDNTIAVKLLVTLVQSYQSIKVSNPFLADLHVVGVLLALY